MLKIIIGEEHTDRKKKSDAFFKTHGVKATEVLLLEDANESLTAVVEQLSPSLFEKQPVGICARYFLEKEKETGALVQLFETIAASPIPVVLEERVLNSVVEKIVKQQKIAIETVLKKEKKETSTIFDIANALATGDRKKIWLTYVSLLKDHAAEALFGILLWKVRQLAGNKKRGTHYVELYKELLEAQHASRQSGLPFPLALERVLLTYAG